MTGITNPVPIDPSKPRSKRPLMGYDIEQWRGEMMLSKFKAQAALGFRNANHYNKMCLLPIIPESIEIIIRLYLDFPRAPGWEKYSLQELFNLMYGEQLAAFEGRKDYTAAKVDLGNRYTRMFNRSPSRKYNWLREDDSSGEREFGGAYSDVETILTLLKQVEDPKAVFERIARQVFALRGVDIEALHPVPTLASPPTRLKTGRKAEPKPAKPPRSKREEPAAKVNARASKAKVTTATSVGRRKAPASSVATHAPAPARRRKSTEVVA